MESLSDAGGRGVGVRAFVGGRWGYAYSTDLSDDGLRDVGTCGARGGGGGRPRRVGRACPSAAGRRRWRASPRPSSARWTTEQKVELALAAERAARAARGRDAGGGHGLLGLGGVGGARRTRAGSRAPTTPPRPGPTRPRSRARAADLMTGLGVALGRDPAALDPEAIGARGGRARARAGRARASRRAAAARWCSTRSWPPRSWRSSARCCPPTPSSAAAPCSRAARARRWPTRRSSSWTTPPTPRVRPARRSTARARPPGGRRWCEGGRLLTFLFDARTARRAGRETTAERGRGSYRSPPSVGTSNLIVSPGDADLAAAAPRRGRRALRDRRGRPPLRGQSGVRNLLGRGLRPAHRGTASWGARYGS